MTPEWQPVVNFVTGAGFITVAGGLIRWGLKVDKGLAATVKSTELLAEKLNGHERLGDERHQALRDDIERIDQTLLLAPRPVKK